MPREEAESQLQLAGFAVLQCPLKPESEPALAALAGETLPVQTDHMAATPRLGAARDRRWCWRGGPSSLRASMRLQPWQVQRSRSPHSAKSCPRHRQHPAHRVQTGLHALRFCWRSQVGSKLGIKPVQPSGLHAACALQGHGRFMRPEIAKGRLCPKGWLFLSVWHAQKLHQHQAMRGLPEQYTPIQYHGSILAFAGQHVRSGLRSPDTVFGQCRVGAGRAL